MQKKLPINFHRISFCLCISSCVTLASCCKASSKRRCSLHRLELIYSVNLFFFNFVLVSSLLGCSVCLLFLLFLFCFTVWLWCINITHNFIYDIRVVNFCLFLLLLLFSFKYGSSISKNEKKNCKHKMTKRRGIFLLLLSNVSFLFIVIQKEK